jgi:hypothetical protein
MRDSLSQRRSPLPRAKDPTEPQLNMEAPFICPECKDAGKGKDAEFDTYQRRYHHRRAVHGIQPKKPNQYAAVSNRPKTYKTKNKMKKNNSLVKVVEHASARNGHASGPSELISRSQADAENLINQVAGGCLEQIKNYAAEFGIPKAVIASGVIDILHSASGGAVHGSRYRMPSL